MKPKSEIISAAQIEKQIEEFAHELNQLYAGKEVVLITILKGAICFTADLMRHLTIPFTLEFVKASSYQGTTPGALTITGLENLSFKNRHILLVDDIYDTGNTLTKVLQQIKAGQPASLKTVVLLLKNKPRTTNYVPDFHLFTIEDQFVIGYGLDFEEHYRGLPGVYAI